jgi:hypothetical protein
VSDKLYAVQQEISSLTVEMEKIDFLLFYACLATTTYEINKINESNCSTRKRRRVGLGA